MNMPVHDPMAQFFSRNPAVDANMESSLGCQRGPVARLFTAHAHMRLAELQTSQRLRIRRAAAVVLGQNATLRDILGCLVGSRLAQDEVMAALPACRAARSRTASNA